MRWNHPAPNMNGVPVDEPLRPRVMKINKVAVRGFRLADLVAAGMPTPVAPADEDPAPADRPKRTRRNPGPKPAHGRPAAPVVSE